MAKRSQPDNATHIRRSRARVPRDSDLHLAVRGFKSIRNEIEIRLPNLTLISGTNSSGKSSFMQAFLLLKQTLDAPFDPGALQIYGANAKLTEMSQALSRGKSRSDVVSDFAITMSRGEQWRKLTFGVDHGAPVVLRDESRSSGNEIALTEGPITGNARSGLADQAETILGSFLQNTGVKRKELRFVASRNRCFLETVVEVPNFGGIALADFTPDVGEWGRTLRSIIHVPGLRGNPERQYPRSAVGENYPGTFETYTASVVDEWARNDPEKLAGLSQDLLWLDLAWKISPKRVNDASIELLVGRMPRAQQGGALDLVSIADVGFGVSQVLPVLVALRAARRNQIVYVEQPEIHLHPRAQYRLADCLAEAAGRGVKVVCETHSNLLLRAVQTKVAQGMFAPRAVSMNWFTRDLETGWTLAREAELDRHGRFGDWPVDFEDVSAEADWAYLEAASETS